MRMQLHAVHAVPDLRVAGGRLGDGVSSKRPLCDHAWWRSARSAATFADKAIALQDAAFKTMKDPRYRHPFYWVAFVSVGKG